MKLITKIGAAAGTLAALSFAAMPAWAQDAAAAAAAAPVPNKGDTTWMITATVIVLLMTVPGLALFYGGLVRSKNMLSVLMQVFSIAAMVMLVWVVYGYSLAFGEGNAFIGDFSKLFLKGVTADSTATTFTDGVVIPEFIFICFQMTFAAITPGLIVGSFAERMRFPAVMLFMLLWVTFIYFPLAHMVWSGTGLLFNMGALDFAGGTVVHINAGIAGLVGCLMVGKRLGYGKEAMPPHSLVMTMIGASLLWVGWFGFNAGSNLEANGVTTLAVINTFVATAAAAIAWMVVEWLAKGKASLLGVVTGAVAGLVAVTPPAGIAGPMGALVLGLVVSPICFFFCTTVKNALGYDDSLDVFGVHGIGGIVGSIATGILVSPALGGVGVDGYAMGHQVMTQIIAVVVALLWSGIGSAILYFIVDKIIGLRVSEDKELEGLDIAEHGERAYHY